jgi:hypothetical protein
VVLVPQLGISQSGDQLIFTWSTVLTEMYQLEYKGDLRDTTWTPLGGPILGTGDSVSVTNSITGQQRFFRVEIMPGK